MGVEEDNGIGTGAFGRLDRGLELVPAEGGERIGAAEMGVAPCDELGVPATAVLPRQRYVVTCGIGARGRAGRAQVDEGRETIRLGIVGQHLSEYLGQVECLPGQRLVPFAAGGVPVDGERAVDGFQHRVHPRG